MYLKPVSTQLASTHYLTMKTPIKTLALLTGAALFSLSTLTAVETDPVGYITSTVYGNGGSGERLTLISPSFHRGSELTATVVSSTSSTIELSSDVVAGAFDGGLYYVEVVNSSGAGFWTDIVSNTVDTLTVNDDLSGFISDGDTLHVRKHHTIGSLFGDANEAGLNSGSNINDADNLQVISFSGGSSSNATYYYSDLSGLEGWRDAALNLSNNEIVAPHEGILVYRKVAGDVGVVFTGTVRNNDINFPIEEGLNVLSVPSAAEKTLGNSGLATYLAAGANINDADNIQVIGANGSTSTYYYSNLSGLEGWRTAALADATSTPLEPGTSFIVLRKAGNGGAVNVIMSSTLPVE